ncbi:hypothetical protein Pse7367_3662 (plasmid) [Thalassoporum mexicanum PCC 7367]|nr:hypothetical protein Pse7367_3662 [Pseudanabaena sp. PCC 7367]
MLFAIENLAYWLFLGMGLALFSLAIFAGGDDDLDADLDADVDIGANLDMGDIPDLDLEADLDPDTDIDPNNGFDALALLRWLGIGKVPLLLLLATDFSLVGLLGWIQNVIIGNLTGRIPTGLLAGIVFLTSVIIALLLGSVISRPLGRAFASSSEDSSSDRILGRVGTVSSATITSDRLGQIDVRDANGNLVTVTAMLPDWAGIKPKLGDAVLVIKHDHDCYQVITAGGVDQDSWLTYHRQRRDRD